MSSLRFKNIPRFQKACAGLRLLVIADLAVGLCYLCAPGPGQPRGVVTGGIMHSKKRVHKGQKTQSIVILVDLARCKCVFWRSECLP
jgi:hypothetical protein